MDKRLLDIIELLTKQTKEGKIKWDATGTANEYKLAMNDGTVVVNTYISNLGTTYYGFKLYNIFGVLAVQENCSKSNEYFPAFYDLYIAAKDSFTQKDSVIDAILSQLKK